jgi:hypothetical protein
MFGLLMFTEPRPSRPMSPAYPTAQDVFRQTLTCKPRKRRSPHRRGGLFLAELLIVVASPCYFEPGLAILTNVAMLSDLV